MAFLEDHFIYRFDTRNERQDRNLSPIAKINAHVPLIRKQIAAIKWDAKIYSQYYCMINGPTALSVWKELRDWMRQREYKLSPKEQRAMEESKKIMLRFGTIGFFVGPSIYTIYTIGARRLRVLPYSTGLRKALGWVPFVVVLPFAFSMAMGASLAPIVMQTEGVLGIKARQLVKEFAKEDAEDALKFAPRDLNLSREILLLLQYERWKPPRLPEDEDLDDYKRQRQLKLQQQPINIAKQGPTAKN